MKTILFHLEQLRQYGVLKNIQFSLAETVYVVVYV